MKNKTLMVGLILIPIILNSCKMDTDTVYSVWIDKATYSQFSNIFGSLSNNTLTKITLTDSQFNSLSLPISYKNNWTDTDIYNWFYNDMYLTSAQSSDLKNFVINTKHCIVAIRTGGYVDMIFK